MPNAAHCRRHLVHVLQQFALHHPVTGQSAGDQPGVVIVSAAKVHLRLAPLSECHIAGNRVTSTCQLREQGMQEGWDLGRTRCGCPRRTPSHRHHSDKSSLARQARRARVVLKHQRCAGCARGPAATGGVEGAVRRGGSRLQGGEHGAHGAVPGQAQQAAARQRPHAQRLQRSAARTRPGARPQQRQHHLPRRPYQPPRMTHGECGDPRSMYGPPMSGGTTGERSGPMSVRSTEIRSLGREMRERNDAEAGGARKPFPVPLTERSSRRAHLRGGHDILTRHNSERCR